MSPRRSAPEPRLWAARRGRFARRGAEGYPSGRKSLGNALRTRGGISRHEPEPVEPVLDRSSTEPLPTVEEELAKLPEEVALLMTPKADERAENEMERIPEADSDVSPVADAAIEAAESDAPAIAEAEGDGEAAEADAAGEWEAELAETSLN